jgi:hypothetical protein
MKRKLDLVFIGHLDAYAMTQTVTLKKLDQSVPHAHGCHADDAEAFYGYASRIGCDHIGIYYNTSKSGIDYSIHSVSSVIHSCGILRSAF